MSSKHCSRRGCKNINPQPITNFSLNKRSTDGYKSDCKDCCNMQSKRYYSNNREAQQKAKRDYYHKNREQQRKRNKEYVKNNPQKAVRRKLIISYGITMGEYNEMLKEQDHRCLVCNKKSISNKRLCVDHCHKTGRVRGLLCVKCNTLIGMADESIDILKNAINYIRHFSNDS